MMIEVHNKIDEKQLQEARNILARASSLALVLSQSFQTAAENPNCEFALVADEHKARAIEAIADLVDVARAVIEPA